MSHITLSGEIKYLKRQVAVEKKIKKKEAWHRNDWLYEKQLKERRYKRAWKKKKFQEVKSCQRNNFLPVKFLKSLFMVGFAQK